MTDPVPGAFVRLVRTLHAEAAVVAVLTLRTRDSHGTLAGAILLYEPFDRSDLLAAARQAASQ